MIIFHIKILLVLLVGSQKICILNVKILNQINYELKISVEFVQLRHLHNLIFVTNFFKDIFVSWYLFAIFLSANKQKTFISTDTCHFKFWNTFIIVLSKDAYHFLFFFIIPEIDTVFFYNGLHIININFMYLCMLFI